MKQTFDIFLGGALAAFIAMHQIDWLRKSTSIGYWLDAQHKGRGVATEACRAFVNEAFTAYGLHRVEIRCGTGNTRSCAIPQRLGFTREGIAGEAEWVTDRWVDLVVWGMLERDWRRLRQAPGSL